MTKKQLTKKLLKDETCSQCDFLARFAKTKKPACLLKVSALPKSLTCDDFKRRKNDSNDWYGFEEITVGDEERDDQEAPER